MQFQIKFSVIVPIYNVEKYLRYCIDSILSQKFVDFEVILIDDGSTDNSGKICDDYRIKDTRCKVLHKVNEGAAEARNKGIEMATGEYLLFVDSDDFWEDTSFLSRINFLLEKKPDFLIFTFKRCNETGDKIWKSYPELDENYVNKLKYEKQLKYLVSKDTYIVSAGCKVVRTELIKSKKIYFEKGIVGEDIDWSFKLVVAAKNLIYSNESGYIYRVRETSVTHNVDDKIKNNLYEILVKWANFFEKSKNEELKQAMLGFLAYEYYIVLGNCVGKDISDEMNLDRYSYLIRYSCSRKTKLCKLVYQCFGKKVASKIYGYVVRKK